MTRRLRLVPRMGRLLLLLFALPCQADPAPLQTTTFSAGEPIAGLQLAPDTNGIMDVFATGLKSGRIAQFRSADGGVSFAKLNELVASGATDTRLMRNGQQRLLLYEDVSRNPFSRLAALRSDDDGLTWNQAGTVTDSVFSIGGSSRTSCGARALYPSSR